MRLVATWCWAFAALCVLGGTPVSAEDRWLAVDKGNHLALSVLFAAGGYGASTLVVSEPWQRAALGGGFTFMLGVAKELYDATGRGEPSLRDLTWDLIGCVLGAGVAWLLDHTLRAPEAEAPLSRAPPPMRAVAW